MVREEWFAEAKRRFGPDSSKWAFRCPSCGHVATVQDWRDAGAAEGNIAFSCVGRWSPNPVEMFAKGGGPCNYAGGGFFKLNPVEVDGENYFEFAEVGE